MFDSTAKVWLAQSYWWYDTGGGQTDTYVNSKFELFLKSTDLIGENVLA